jgi:hypothetical protein
MLAVALVAGAPAAGATTRPQPPAGALATAQHTLAPAQAAEMKTYTDPAGRWQVRYPVGVLAPEVLGNGTTIFISRDRSTFFAIDSIAGDDASPTALQARAIVALTRIYATRPATITALAQLDAPWQAGVSFATKKGSQGIAVYLVDAGGDEGWTYGVLLGSKKTSDPALKEAALQTLATLQLASPGGDEPEPGGIVKLK